MVTMMSDESYAGTIARLRHEAYERSVRDLEYEANRLNSEIAEIETQAFEADQDGRVDDVDWLMRDAREKTAELNNVMMQLPQAPQYSETKLEWARRRPDLVNHPGFAQSADAWHNYILGLGVQDDSPEYQQMMTTALEPQGYEPMPTPDDLIKTMNETSRICRKDPLTAKQYNKHVSAAQEHTAAQLRAAGKLR
jgi:hypothetical protein